MKNKYAIWLIVFIFGGAFLSLCQAQSSWERSGRTVLEERPVESFTALEINGIFEVYLQQDGVEKLEIEADEYALESVEVYQRGDKLRIKRSVNCRRFGNFGKVRLYITVDNLYDLEINGACDLRCDEPIRLQNLQFECNNVGRTELVIEAEKLDIQTNTVGKVYLAGSADTVHLENTSLSRINAYDLYAQVLHLKNTSMGGIRIRAEKELYIDSTGVGNIYCKGDPQVKRTTINGFGKVRFL